MHLFKYQKCHFNDQFVRFHHFLLRYHILIFSSICLNVRPDRVNQRALNQLWKSGDQLWCFLSSMNQRWKTSNIWNSAVRRWLSDNHWDFNQGSFFKNALSSASFPVSPIWKIFRFFAKKRQFRSKKDILRK